MEQTYFCLIFDNAFRIGFDELIKLCDLAKRCNLQLETGIIGNTFYSNLKETSHISYS